MFGTCRVRCWYGTLDSVQSLSMTCTAESRVGNELHEKPPRQKPLDRCRCREILEGVWTAARITQSLPSSPEHWPLARSEFASSQGLDHWVPGEPGTGTATGATRTLVSALRCAAACGSPPVCAYSPSVISSWARCSRPAPEPSRLRSPLECGVGDSPPSTASLPRSGS